LRLKTLNKRISTSEDGIFYKEIIDENNKVVDKIFLIRYRDVKRTLKLGSFYAGF
jgi:hypothetical protein